MPLSNSKQDRRGRNRTALVAVLVAALILGTFALVGESLLAYQRITVEDLQVAGGILLMAVALQMINGTTDPSSDSHVGVVPLATPLLAGPGTMVALLVLIDECKAAADRLAILAGVALAHFHRLPVRDGRRKPVEASIRRSRHASGRPSRRRHRGSLRRHCHRVLVP